MAANFTSAQLFRDSPQLLRDFSETFPYQSCYQLQGYFPFTPLAYLQAIDKPINEKSPSPQKFTDFSIQKILSPSGSDGHGPESFNSGRTSRDQASPASSKANDNGCESPSLSLSSPFGEFLARISAPNHQQSISNNNIDQEEGNKRKQRTVYRQYQINRLEQAFSQQQYMVGTDRVALAKTLGLTETQVRIWFQNRRSKWRKDMREFQSNAKKSENC